MRIDVNSCKCQSPAEGLVLKIERYGQRLTQGYSAHGGSYSWPPVQILEGLEGSTKSAFVDIRERVRV